MKKKRKFNFVDPVNGWERQGVQTVTTWKRGRSMMYIEEEAQHNYRRYTLHIPNGTFSLKSVTLEDATLEAEKIIKKMEEIKAEKPV